MQGAWWSLLTLFGVHMLAVASPGPAFLSVVQTAIANPRRVTLTQVVGLGMASAVWACAATFGLEALLVHVAGLYRVLEVAGGMYLAWIGVQSWLHAKQPLPTAAAGGAVLTPVQALRRGFMTNIANPKVMVFYGSIFTSILKPEMPGWVRVAAFFLVIFDNVAWYGGLAMLLSAGKSQAAYARAKAGIDRTAGTVMLLFGLHLVWDGIRG